jgi:hypothetical protein
MKMIIKFEAINEGLLKITYSDNSEEIITNDQFTKFTKEGKVKMGFIIP